jgi:hypothetical protein
LSNKKSSDYPLVCSRNFFIWRIQSCLFVPPPVHTAFFSSSNVVLKMDEKILLRLFSLIKPILFPVLLELSAYFFILGTVPAQPFTFYNFFRSFVRDMSIIDPLCLPFSLKRNSLLQLVQKNMLKLSP